MDKSSFRRIIINCDSEKVGSTNTIFNKHISKDIHVRRQKFQCIINLNTTVCKHKSEERRKSDKHSRNFLTDERTKEDSKVGVRRILPQCLRQCCRKKTFRGRYSSHAQRKQNDVRVHDNSHLSHGSGDRHEGKIITKHKHCRKHRRHGLGASKPETKLLLSPISSLSIPDELDNLTYEDISSSPLPSEGEKPSSYKRKCCKHKIRKLKKKESKLDTLIRRTKERERKQVEQSRKSKTWYDTGLRETTDQSNAMSQSDMDISIHTQTTIHLEEYIPYSPSKPIDDLESLLNIYSPISSDNDVPKKTENTSFETINIEEPPPFWKSVKKEPTMVDFSPNCTDLSLVKKEASDVDSKCGIKEEVHDLDCDIINVKSEDV